MNKVRILVADDHAIIRRGLKTLLEHETDFEVVAEAADGMEAVELSRRVEPDLAVLDIGMPNLNGIEAARQISSESQSVQIVVLTVHADECYLLSALKAGARGYVLKSSAEFEMVEAARAVSQGRAYFSPKVSRILAEEYVREISRRDVQDSYDLLSRQERQILQLLAEGQANKDIASVLNISPTTVMCHRQHIFRKLDLHSLADLILYAVRRGVIDAQTAAAAHASQSH